jgi:SOS response regulatory protein OraA/RecX
MRDDDLGWLYEDEEGGYDEAEKEKLLREHAYNAALRFMKHRRRTWREVYSFLRPRYHMSCRDEVIDMLTLFGKVPSDAEFVEDYMKRKGKGMSKENLLSELEARQIDLGDEEVKEVLDRLFPEDAAQDA